MGHAGSRRAPAVTSAAQRSRSSLVHCPTTRVRKSPQRTSSAPVAGQSEMRALGMAGLLRGPGHWGLREAGSGEARAVRAPCAEERVMGPHLAVDRDGPVVVVALQDRAPSEQNVQEIRVELRRLLADPGLKYVALDFGKVEFFEA